MRTRWAVVVLGLLAACGSGATETPERVQRAAPVLSAADPDTATTPTDVTTPSLDTAPVPTAAGTAPPPRPATLQRRASTTTTGAAPIADPLSPPSTIDIVYVLERHTSDEATADFESLAEATLSDGRGWSRAAFRFERRGDPADAPYRIVLAEGEEVDRLCLPYDTYGKYSCQNGSVVALNADRWRASTPKWTGDLESYRRMLVNHEVGHLLGQKHPRPQCPRPGTPAPVMNQQSTELNGCLPNPWPLDSEVTAAARHDRKLAPGPGD